MGAFDGAVFVGHAPVVAGRFHPVVFAQGLEASGQVLRYVLGQIAEGSGETVGSELVGDSAQFGEGTLNSLGQGGEGLAVNDHGDVSVARPWEAKVEVQVPERFSLDGDFPGLQVGEVGNGERAGRPLRLREHDFLFRTVLGSPRPNPPFQGPAVVRLEFRFGVQQIVEHRDGLDVGASLQNGDDLGFEERG